MYSHPMTSPEAPLAMESPAETHPATDKVEGEEPPAASAVEGQVFSQQQQPAEAVEAADSAPLDEDTATDEEQENSSLAGEAPRTEPRPQTDFLQSLTTFFKGRGVPFQAPRFNKRELDLEKLWGLAYVMFGGYDLVCQRKQWAAVGRHFNPPKSMTNLSFHMKRLYERMLLPYERHLQGVEIPILATPPTHKRPRSNATPALSGAVPAIPAERQMQRPISTAAQYTASGLPLLRVTPTPTGHEAVTIPTQQPRPPRPPQAPQASAAAARPQRSTRGKRSSSHFGEFSYEWPFSAAREEAEADVVASPCNWVTGEDAGLEGDELIGYHVQTWAEEEGGYCKGLVVGFHADQGRHVLEYGDGRRAAVELSGQHWRLCADDDSDAMAVQQLAQLAGRQQADGLGEEGDAGQEGMGEEEEEDGGEEGGEAEEDEDAVLAWLQGGKRRRQEAPPSQSPQPCLGESLLPIPTAAAATAGATARAEQEEALAAVMLAAAVQVAGNEAVASWFAGALSGEGGAENTPPGPAQFGQPAAAANGGGGGNHVNMPVVGQGANGSVQQGSAQAQLPAQHAASVALMRQAAALIRGLQEELQREKSRAESLAEELQQAQGRVVQAEADARVAQAAGEEARRMFAMLLQAAGNLPVPQGMALPPLRPPTGHPAGLVPKRF